MGPRPTTIIVELRLLIREALKSLMAENSYRVVCDIGSTAEFSAASGLADGPKLVVLGAQSADIALIEAVGARRLWPDSKIILLYENASPADFSEAANVGVRWLRFVVCFSGDANQHARPDRHQGSPPHGRGQCERSGDTASPTRRTTSEADRARGPDPGWSREGHANKVIARTCDIAEETVKVHIRSILQKIRVENRTQAALWAMANGYAS